MIAAIASVAPDDVSAALAACLAVHRARAGAGVLLADAGAGARCAAWLTARAAARFRPCPGAADLGHDTDTSALETALARCDALVLDAGSCRRALIAADVAVVPIAPAAADPDRHYGLVAALNAARIFNPGLHVLFAMVVDDDGCDGAELRRGLGRVRGYAAEVLSAHVAGAVVPRAALLAPGPGRCAADTAAGTPLWLDTLCDGAFGTLPLRRRRPVF